jgi:nicotinate-nucleotide adenylyltransferase
MAPFERRFATARAKAAHPRILATDLERRLGTRYTYDTLRALRRYYSRTRFVWLMGADNLGQIHRWQHWRDIFRMVPVAVFDRPPYRLRMLGSPAAAAFGRARIKPSQARGLASRAPPAWVFYPSRLEPLSSTEIRARARGLMLSSLRQRNAIPTSQEHTSPMGILIEPQFAKMNADASVFPAPFEAMARPRTTLETLSPEGLRDAVVKSLDDDKGEDIVVIDLRGKSNIADFMVIATGRSARQVGAMADHLLRGLQPELSFRMAIEGLPQGDWALVDCGDVVVHLFRPEVRDFYALEKMWGLEPPAIAQGESPAP